MSAHQGLLHPPYAVRAPKVHVPSRAPLLQLATAHSRIAVNHGVLLGRLGGIEVSARLSAFGAVLLVFLSLALAILEDAAGESESLAWTGAAVGVLLLAASMAIRSLAQAAAAASRDLPVRSVSFAAPGGVLEVHKELWDDAADLWIGCAGLVAHLVLGAGFLVLGDLLAAPSSDIVATAHVLASTLGWVNLSLLLIQLVPAYPLDGGRLLRAVLPSSSAGAAAATRVGAGIGHFVGLALMAAGLIRLVEGGGYSATLLIVGWLLYRAVDTSTASLAPRLRDFRVEDVMQRCPRVYGTTPVADLVDASAEHLLSHRGFHVVVPPSTVAGLVTAREIRELPRRLWGTTAVEDVMIPVASLPTVPTDAPLSAALEILGPYDVHHLPVVRDGQLLGAISRDAILALGAPLIARQADTSNEGGPILGRPASA